MTREPLRRSRSPRADDAWRRTEHVAVPIASAAGDACAWAAPADGIVVALCDAEVRLRLASTDLRIEPGVTALVGGNGSGKSTVLALMAGRLAPTAGSVHVLGAPATTPAAARHRGDVPQAVEFPVRSSVAELLGVARSARGVSGSAAATAAERLGLTPLLRRTAGRLSGGERQRVALAAALMGEPRVWLLDEPAAALDREGLACLAAWVREHADRGGTVVVSVHRDEEVAAYDPHRVVHLAAGSMVDDAVARST